MSEEYRIGVNTLAIGKESRASFILLTREWQAKLYKSKWSNMRVRFCRKMANLAELYSIGGFLYRTFFKVYIAIEKATGIV
jgi:hypothetical protein